MKSVTGLILAIAVVLPLTIHAAKFPDDYIVYGIEEFDGAKKEARARSKNILLVLSLARCPSCEYVMAQFATEKLREVYKNNFIGVYVIWEEKGGQELWYTYGPELRGAPHFILMTPSGEPICRVYGGFNNPHEGAEIGKKMIGLYKPAGIDPLKQRLPECS